MEGKLLKELRLQDLKRYGMQPSDAYYKWLAKYFWERERTLELRYKEIPFSTA